MTSQVVQKGRNCPFFMSVLLSYFEKKRTKKKKAKQKQQILSYKCFNPYMQQDLFLNYFQFANHVMYDVVCIIVTTGVIRCLGFQQDSRSKIQKTRKSQTKLKSKETCFASTYSLFSLNQFQYKQIIISIFWINPCDENKHEYFYFLQKITTCMEE